MLKVNVISGDITNTIKNVEAIATLVRSENVRLGNVNVSIVKRYHDYYHSFLDRLINEEVLISDGQVFIVKGINNSENLTFKDVIFVIDDLNLLLKTLVFNTLSEAEKSGYKRIAIPTMRTELASIVIKKTMLNTVLGMKQGIMLFRNKYCDSSLIVDIVVYRDTLLQKLLTEHI